MVTRIRMTNDSSSQFSRSRSRETLGDVDPAGLVPVVNKVERLATTPRFRCATIRLAPFAASGGERGKAETAILLAI